MDTPRGGGRTHGLLQMWPWAFVAEQTSHTAWRFPWKRLWTGGVEGTHRQVQKLENEEVCLLNTILQKQVFLFSSSSGFWFLLSGCHLSLLMVKSSYLNFLLVDLMLGFTHLKRLMRLFNIRLKIILLSSGMRGQWVSQILTTQYPRSQWEPTGL